MRLLIPTAAKPTPNDANDVPKTRKRAENLTLGFADASLGMVYGYEGGWVKVICSRKKRKWYQHRRHHHPLHHQRARKTRGGSDDGMREGNEARRRVCGCRRPHPFTSSHPPTSSHAGEKNEPRKNDEQRLIHDVKNGGSREGNKI